MIEQKKLIPALVGGLPAGLAIAVVAGLIVYYAIDDDGEAGRADRPPDRGSALPSGTPPDEAALGNWFHVLANVLDPRPATDPAAVAKTGKYLESTLGPRNIGFLTSRPLVDAVDDAGGRATVDETWSWIEAELTGEAQPGEVVLVAARFDSGIATGEGEPAAEHRMEASAARAAVLLAVARAMAGDRPDRTVRFVFAAGLPDAGGPVVDRVASAGDRVVAHLVLGDGLGTGNGGVAAIPGDGFTRVSGDPSDPGLTVANPAALTAAAEAVTAAVREAAREQR